MECGMPLSHPIRTSNRTIFDVCDALLPTVRSWMVLCRIQYNTISFHSILLCVQKKHIVYNKLHFVVVKLRLIFPPTNNATQQGRNDKTRLLCRNTYDIL